MAVVGITKKLVKSYLKSSKKKRAAQKAVPQKGSLKKFDQKLKKTVDPAIASMEKTNNRIKEIGRKVIDRREKEYGKETYKKMWKSKQSERISGLKEKIKKYRNIKAKDYLGDRYHSGKSSKRSKEFYKSVGTKQKRTFKNQDIRYKIEKVRRLKKQKYEDLFK